MRGEREYKSFSDYGPDNRIVCGGCGKVLGHIKTGSVECAPCAKKQKREDKIALANILSKL